MKRAKWQEENVFGYRLEVLHGLRRCDGNASS